ncbi:hypothetical protein DMB38_17575 [Streptomyces sp. WAC 06738]|uniref:hypothetical protein n=1 Tax=Streptomyces sp. WAC 06738 TaxID=2203210 RepID=UPI000F6CF318|nr:hypothetical protein [Streptomyces sp. WAC 06738]AZM47362.1 hypothetical protein DMB38_17575 [Streptomyces sp. WAC 06738]
MSSFTETGRRTGSTADAASAAVRLRNLYYVRFGFAVVWAALVALSASDLNPASVALLVLYPVFDAAAAVIDLRTPGAARPRALLRGNAALSLLTAAGLAVAVASDIPDVLRVWGAWAITAGVVQLAVAISRYRLGAQWAMILSGGISALAGSRFLLTADGADSLTSLAGYATLGGVFFLISAARLHRRATPAT